LSSAAPTAPCPTCGTLCARRPANPFGPFCSERCRLVDLGGWLSESYRIAGEDEDGKPPAKIDDDD